MSERLHDYHRHGTTAGAAIMPMIAQEREAKQVATQFKKGNKASPDGRRGKETVNTEPCSPIPIATSRRKN